MYKLLNLLMPCSCDLDYLQVCLVQHTLCKVCTPGQVTWHRKYGRLQLQRSTVHEEYIQGRRCTRLQREFHSEHLCYGTQIHQLQRRESMYPCHPVACMLSFMSFSLITVEPLFADKQTTFKKAKSKHSARIAGSSLIVSRCR